MTAETRQTGRSRQWPGERDPTQWDTDQANQVLTSARLNLFRAALLHAEGDFGENAASSEVEMCITRAFEGQARQQGQLGSSDEYTYPMALLSELPSLPSESEVHRLQGSFGLVFNQHILLKELEIGGPINGSPPPYLQLALACIASVFDSSIQNASNDSSHNVSTDLFTAGIDVWTVMLEVQNTEARILNAVYAAILLATFGTLSTDTTVWRKTSGILCQVITMSRRLHLTDSHITLQITGDAFEKDASKKSSLFSYMLLVDVLNSLHYNTPPNYSVTEIFVKMPSSDQAFRAVYNSLIHGYPLTEPMSNEDVLLLIVALLNDILSNHYRHAVMAAPAAAQAAAPRPAAPLSAESDFLRTTRLLKAALHRLGRATSASSIRPDILALQRFAKVLASNSRIVELPGMAGHNNTIDYRQSCIEIDPEAIELGWAILGDVETSTKPSQQRTSIWLPFVAFYSGLVLWRYTVSQGGDARHGGLRLLIMYENAIAQLPEWMCCLDMTSTLKRLRQS